MMLLDSTVREQITQAERMNQMPIMYSELCIIGAQREKNDTEFPQVQDH